VNPQVTPQPALQVAPQAPSQVDPNQKPLVESQPSGCAPTAPGFACDHCCDRCGCFAWAGVYFLQPIALANKFTALNINTQNSLGTTLSSKGVEFDYQFEAAPQVVLGYQFHDGLAARARYWHFEESTHNDLTAPGPTDSATIF
jgi:hypothetical protein